MPFFDWNAATGSAILNQRFWIYWAVTIPLTLGTVTIWVIWIRRQLILGRREDFEARHSGPLQGPGTLGE